jgi:hypothetical protein
MRKMLMIKIIKEIKLLEYCEFFILELKIILIFFIDIG